MAYDFVRHASSFAIGMQDEDDVQLLRLRTRKNEIVIVPGKLTRFHKIGKTDIE